MEQYCVDEGGDHSIFRPPGRLERLGAPPAEKYNV